MGRPGASDIVLVDYLSRAPSIDGLLSTKPL